MYDSNNGTKLYLSQLFGMIDTSAHTIVFLRIQCNQQQQQWQYEIERLSYGILFIV